MKYLCSLLVCLFIFQSNASCQVEDYLSELPFVINIKAYKNNLIFNYIDQDTSYLAISDLESTNHDYSVFRKIAIGFADFAISDDFLYFTSRVDMGEVYRLDLTVPDEEPVKVLDSLGLPVHITIVDTKLVVSIKTDEMTSDNRRYSRIESFNLENLGDNPKVLIDSIVISDLEAYKDQFIYSTHHPERCAFLFDGSKSVRIGCPQGPINCFATRNDELYTTPAIIVPGLLGKLIKYDILSANEKLTTVNDSIGTWVYSLAIHDNYIYINDISYKTITRIKLDELSSLFETGLLDEINVYPNPTSDILNTESKEGKQFKIYSTRGVEVMDGIINSSNQINVKKLPSGLYFLHVVDKGIVKFQVIH